MVTHPGPQPEPFTFPNGAAARLREAAEALLDELESLDRGLDDSWGRARVGFEGRTRQQTEACCAEESSRAADLRARLHEQIGQIADAQVQARDAEARRDDERRAWRRDLLRWEEREREAAR